MDNEMEGGSTADLVTATATITATITAEIVNINKIIQEVKSNLKTFMDLLEILNEGKLGDMSESDAIKTIKQKQVREILNPKIRALLIKIKEKKSIFEELLAKYIEILFLFLNYYVLFLISHFVVLTS